MKTTTLYQVKHMLGWQDWKHLYIGEDGDFARGLAEEMVTRHPGRLVRISETEFKGGRPVRVKEYDVNPPHCSENQLPERGPEIVLRQGIDL
jgi:hypothetical protein